MLLTYKLSMYLYYRWQQQGFATTVSKPMPFDKKTLRERRRRSNEFVRTHGGKVLRVRDEERGLNLVVRGPATLFDALRSSEVASFVRPITE